MINCSNLVLTAKDNKGNWIAIIEPGTQNLIHGSCKQDTRSMGASKQEATKLARPELGEKRHCLSCETKFYDLKKEPPVCPKCGTVFEMQVPEKPVVVEKTKSKDKAAETKTDDTATTGDPDTISLEEADEDSGDTVDGEDIPDDIPDADDDDEESESDNSFVENDDDEDDMSDLVKVTKDDKEDT